MSGLPGGRAVGETECEFVKIAGAGTACTHHWTARLDSAGICCHVISAQHKIMKPSKTPGICRIDQPSHRTHGFFLRAARDGQIYSGFLFRQKIRRPGAGIGSGPRASWQAAENSGTARPEIAPLLGGAPRRKGRSGIVGVQRVIDRQSKPWRKYWRAMWSPEKGVVRKQQFSIRKHGEEKAKQLDSAPGAPACGAWWVKCPARKPET